MVIAAWQRETSLVATLGIVLLSRRLLQYYPTCQHNAACAILGNSRLARMFCVPQPHRSQAAAFRRLPAHSKRRAACMPRACWRVRERYAAAWSLCLARGGTSIFCFFAGGPSEQSFARRRASRSALTPVLGRPCFAQSSLSCATVRPPSSGGAAPCTSTRPHNDAPARASDALGCNARASVCSGADAHGSKSVSTDAPVLVRVP
jgi:hypothetical protein